jgi:hypothetical protein
LHTKCCQFLSCAGRTALPPPTQASTTPPSAAEAGGPLGLVEGAIQGSQPITAPGASIPDRAAGGAGAGAVVLGGCGAVVLSYVVLWCWCCGPAMLTYVVLTYTIWCCAAVVLTYVVTYVIPQHNLAAAATY